MNIFLLVTHNNLKCPHARLLLLIGQNANTVRTFPFKSQIEFWKELSRFATTVVQFLCAIGDLKNKLYYRIR